MIRKFRGDYRWLSNFAQVPITLDGVTYASVEHAYQSAKSNNPLWKKLCADPKWTAGQVKTFSHEIKKVDDWDEIKFGVMWVCVKQKFNTEPFKTKLLTTGHEYIQEGNNHGDEYWGVNLETGVGENHLGELIMEMRNKLYDDENV